MFGLLETQLLNPRSYEYNLDRTFSLCVGAEEGGAASTRDLPLFVFVVNVVVVVVVDVVVVVVVVIVLCGFLCATFHFQRFAVCRVGRPKVFAASIDVSVKRQASGVISAVDECNACMRATIRPSLSYHYCLPYHPSPQPSPHPSSLPRSPHPQCCTLVSKRSSYANLLAANSRRVSSKVAKRRQLSWQPNFLLFSPPFLLLFSHPLPLFHWHWSTSTVQS